MKEPSFLYHLNLLLFYRNSPSSDEKITLSILNKFGYPKLDDLNQTKFSMLHDRLPIACVSQTIFNQFKAEKRGSLNEVVIYLIEGYLKKNLKPEEAYSAARSLSRLGNLYYSSYCQLPPSAKSTDSYRRKVKKDLKELIKNTLNILVNITIDNKETKIKLYKITPAHKNSSDLIKDWLQEFQRPEFDKKTHILKEGFSISNIVFIYILSAKLYMYSAHSLMGVHQYRKILAILRSNAQLIKDSNLGKKNINNFLNVLKNTIVRRSLQIASWNSSSTDRSQVYKYKHALGFEHIFHDKSFAKYNYKNVSNAPDVKEAIWHFVALNEILVKNNIYLPENVVKTNPNQSFINQTNSIHTMYARLNELDVQCIINKSLLLNLCPNDILNINVIYKMLRDAEKYENENFEKYGIDISILSNLEQLPYLVSNWIFCLHSMIQILQTKGLSYLFTFSTLADQYRRLGDLLKYYELCRFLKLQNKIKCDVFDLTSEMIGKDAIKGMDTTSMYQMATRNYRSAISAHTRGNAYRYLISNMYFLEDDFHDNVFHFSISFERHRINNGEIMENLRKLNKELSISQFFDYDTHINNEELPPK